MSVAAETESERLVLRFFAALSAGDLEGVRALFRPGDPKIFVDSIASRGDLVMMESHSGGSLADGRPYENLYAWAVEVRDGKIYVVREYFDSHYVMQLMGSK